jgi:hypothetical protein
MNRAIFTRWVISCAVAVLVVGVGSTFSADPPKETAKETTTQTVPDLGPCASLHGKQVFPAENDWNEDVSKSPIDRNSENLIDSIGAGKPLHPDFGTVFEGEPLGIPYMIVDGKQQRLPIDFTDYPGESDRGRYPIPLDAPIEGGPKSNGDRHVLVIDRDTWTLYELARAAPRKDAWAAACGAIFDLKKNAIRPAGWTSADAAGLPIFPGLVRYDEVMEQKAINHALRFTVTRSRQGYVAPARHYASRRTDPDLPPMGMRVRLKASVDISGYPPECQVILTALKKYGMIVADNGGNWFISGAPDPRWNDENLGMLKRIKGKDFEVIRMGEVVTKGA